jgi:hypothetical protein
MAPSNALPLSCAAVEIRKAVEQHPVFNIGPILFDAQQRQLQRLAGRLV